MATKTKRSDAPRQRLADAWGKATKLWQILAIALADLRVAEKSQCCQIDMQHWLIPHGTLRGRRTRCSMCLAGAVIHRRLPWEEIMDPMGLWPTSFPNERPKLRALDSLRTGGVSFAWQELQDNVLDAETPLVARTLTLEFLPIPDYHGSKNAWWRRMRSLLAALKKADL